MRVLTVSDVFKLQIGKTPARGKLEYWNNGDHEWVSIKDLGTYGKYVGSTKETISELGRKESKIVPVPADTLIMSFKLSLGKTAITTRETYTNEAIMAFLDRGDYPVNLDYMYHQFRSKDWTDGTNIAVMGQTLNKKTLGASLICVPEAEEQQTIAERLDFVLEQISLGERQLAKLDELIKSRFIEMFGDVDGEHRRLEDCCTKVMGGKTPSMKHPEYYGGDIPFIKSGDVKEDIVSSGALWLSDAAIEKASVKLVPAGSVLVVTRSALLRRKVCTSICTCDAAINQDIRAFIPKGEFTSSYLLWSIRSHEQDLLKQVRSVNTSGMDIQQLYDLSIYVAPIALQREFATFVQKVDKSKIVAQQQIEELQTLYDSLAQEYFVD